MSYKHPGQEFLLQHGDVQCEDDVFRYVKFLRQESRLTDQPPIDLIYIYQHFEIPTPRRAPLDEQQGILVDSSTGIILIKEDDPIVRQRFTEGHELMELLFDAQEQVRINRSLPNWSDEVKERLCDRGAAELLMPASSFVPRLNELGISLQTGRSLSTLYQTSLLATLVRMIQLSSGNYALVIWHSALKPTELKKCRVAQPQQKLRVWWRIQTHDWTGGFIPKDKSVADDSLIYHAHATGRFCCGMETIHLGWGSINCQIEALSIQIGDKLCVVSLLHG